MVRWRIQNPLQGPAVVNDLRVNPKLEDQIELQVDEEGGKRDTDEGQGLVDTEGEIALEQRLSEGRAEVVFFGGVMDLVTRPHQVDL